MAATRARLAGVVRRNGDDETAVPCRLVFQLPTKLGPTLIENRTIQAGLLFHVLAVLLAVPPCGPGQIPNLQIFDDDHGVVLADLARSLVQKVFPGIGDAGMKALDSGFRFLPVAAEFHLATHRPLIPGEALPVFLETVERFDVAAVAQGGKTDNAHVDANRLAVRQGLIDFPLGLDRDEPFAASMADGRVFDRAEYVAAVAVANPAQLGQKHPAVALIEFDALRIAEAVRLALLLEAREVGAFLEEIPVGAFKMLERLLQGLAWRFVEPPCLRFRLPCSERLAQSGIAELLFPRLASILLQSKRLVENESARPGEAAHLALLLAVGLEFESVGLKALHADSIVWSMGENNEIRRGRHCVFDMHVHLVFMTKYRHNVFDQEAIDRLRELFAKVCNDFDAQLVEMDGEHDHVHLRVSYPPKVAVSALVNSLKGASSRVLRKERPDIAQRSYYQGALWSPSYLASSCGGARISIIRQYIEQQATLT